MAALVFKPEDFLGTDWDKLDAAIVAGQVKLLNTLTNEQLQALTGRVDKIVDDAARRAAILGWVKTILGIGLRLVAL